MNFKHSELDLWATPLLLRSKEKSKDLCMHVCMNVYMYGTLQLSSSDPS